ncbi:MAG: carboxypeptidase regulatory-like domain-containing protein [Planctomycetes bacterium]|nr:carboxypeptidase regulatory-like domain-containing protein [Planctomycetota bacterium]
MNARARRLSIVSLMILAAAALYYSWTTEVHRMVSPEHRPSAPREDAPLMARGTEASTGESAVAGARRDAEQDITDQDAAVAVPVAKSGRVVDSTGAPVAGASVELLTLPTRRWTAETGADGRFKVIINNPSAADGFDRIRVARAGYSNTVVYRLPMSRDSGGLGDFILYKPSALRGTVANDAGPVGSGVHVQVVSNERKWNPALLPEFSTGFLYNTTTGPAGEFEFLNLQACEAIVNVYVPGFAPLKQKVALDPEISNVVRLVLHPEIQLDGTVIDDDGNKIEGALVALLAIGTDRGREWYFTYRDGRFSIPALPTAPGVLLRISACGHATRTFDINNLPADRVFHIFNKPAVRLQILCRDLNAPGQTRPYSITPNDIKVILARFPTSCASPGIRVPGERLYNLNVNNVEVVPECYQSTGEEGWTAVESRERSTWRAVAGSPIYGYGASELFDEPLPDAPTPVIPIILQKGITVIGKVLGRDGKPVPRVAVKLARTYAGSVVDERTSEAADDGFFQFYHVPEGGYELSGSSYLFEIDREFVNINASDNVAEIHPRAGKAGRVHGKLTIRGNPPGRAVPMRICYKDENGGWITAGYAAADDGGNFSYGPLRAGNVEFFAAPDAKPRASIYNFFDLAPEPDPAAQGGIASANVAVETDTEVNISIR